MNSDNCEICNESYNVNSRERKINYCSECSSNYISVCGKCYDEIMGQNKNINFYKHEDCTQYILCCYRCNKFICNECSDYKICNLDDKAFCIDCANMGYFYDDNGLCKWCHEKEIRDNELDNMDDEME